MELQQTPTFRPLPRELLAFPVITRFAGENKITDIITWDIRPSDTTQRESVFHFIGILPLAILLCTRELRETASGIVTTIVLTFQLLLNLLRCACALDASFLCFTVAFYCPFIVSMSVTLSLFTQKKFLFMLNSSIPTAIFTPRFKPITLVMTINREVCGSGRQIFLASETTPISFWYICRIVGFIPSTIDLAITKAAPTREMITGLLLLREKIFRVARVFIPAIRTPFGFTRRGSMHLFARFAGRRELITISVEKLSCGRLNLLTFTASLISIGNWNMHQRSCLQFSLTGIMTSLALCSQSIPPSRVGVEKFKCGRKLLFTVGAAFQWYTIHTASVPFTVCLSSRPRTGATVAGVSFVHLF